MKQRLIIVPKNSVSEQLLLHNKAIKNQLFELYLNEKEFNTLYKKGFFKLINQIALTNIDDYEDDCLQGEEKIRNVLEVIKSEKDFFDPNFNNIVEQIIIIFGEALNRGTGVYFYF